MTLNNNKKILILLNVYTIYVYVCVNKVVNTSQTFLIDTEVHWNLVHTC